MIVGSDKSCAVVDFVSFRGNRCVSCNRSGGGGGFIVKELAIVNTNTGASSWYLFKPPTPSSNSTAASSDENDWLTRNFHGLTWDEGYVTYNQLNEILSTELAGFNKVYVKGEEKAKFLQSRCVTTAEIIDLTSLSCPSLRDLEYWCRFPNYYCNQHNARGFVCARNQANKLSNWFLQRTLFQ